MSRLLPDLMEGHRAQTARLAIGEDLVITWAYEEDGGPNSLGRRLVFTATEADGTRLGVMAVVPVFTPEGSVPGSVVAEVLQGTSAAARWFYRDHVRVTSESERSAATQPSDDHLDEGLV